MARLLKTRWTNPSVKLLAGTDDPVSTIRSRAREMVLDAIDHGWTGPPYDPLALAGLRGISVLANSEIRDARTVPLSRAKIQIEFNPNQARGRARYSLAHELAHTLFPDCGEQVRNRARHEDMEGDDWQLEALCNIAAAEILMPIGAFSGSFARDIAIQDVMELQKRFDVSTEALVIRLAETSDRALCAFCASPRAIKNTIQYKLDYVVASTSWNNTIQHRLALPEKSVVEQCTAIGYSATGVEGWWSADSGVRVEAVGIPPYPGGSGPRVVGLLSPTSEAEAPARVKYVFGSATKPQTDSAHRIVVHVVNDKTPLWGGAGFAAAVRSAWPEIQVDFKDWAEKYKSSYKLGGVRIVRVDDSLSVASVVAQRGYGPSSSPRIRYHALRSGLATVADIAEKSGSSVHMPRIGTGHAGGRWSIIRDIVAETLSVKSIPVTVYDLPGTKPVVEAQFSLLDVANERLAAAQARWR